IDAFIDLDADLIVEAASQDAIRSYGVKIVESGKDLMVMSVGALLDDVLRNRLYETATAKRHKIIIPTGAIAGLDAIKACSGKISEVRLVTRKRPSALAGSPFFEINKIDGASITQETILFDGSASEAVRLFPSNVNVAAILSLAGIGKEKTKVVVIADPSVKTNLHEITVKGEFGEFAIHMNNITHPQNQKTSYLAVLSAIEAIRTYGSED
ncbi:MAG: aspartate dehydrogenase, partial [Nitrososphaerales archaeon]